MTFRKTLENTASDFVSQVAVPVAEKVREGADDLLDRIGTESRHLGERLTAQVEHVPEATLSRLNLVTAARSRRRTVFGVIIGLVIGATLVRLFSGEEGARRRRALMSKMGTEPSPPAPITGELPK